MLESHPMLRIVVLILALLNMGFLAWQEGWLGPWVDNITGSAREPQRLQQEVHPERLVVQGEAQTAEPPATADSGASDASDALPESLVANAASESLQAASAASASGVPAAPVAEAAAAGGSQCLEAGPFSRDEESQIQTVLARALPAGSWRVDRFPVPGLWLIYMGPYPDQQSLDLKRGELQRMGGISHEEVRSPVNLRMGLSLGRYNSEAAANAALSQFQTKGVRTARVVSIRPPMDVSVIRVQQADTKVQQQVKGLPLPPERGFVACLVP